jgi:hypothetical protein
MYERGFEQSSVHAAWRAWEDCQGDEEEKSEAAREAAIEHSARYAQWNIERCAKLDFSPCKKLCLGFYHESAGFIADYHHEAIGWG